MFVDAEEVEAFEMEKQDIVNRVVILKDKYPERRIRRSGGGLLGLIENISEEWKQKNV